MSESGAPAESCFACASPQSPPRKTTVRIVQRGNASRTSLLPLVVDGGRLATITSDAPPGERHIRVSNAYVSPNGIRLEQLASRFAQRGLSIPIAGIHSLSEASRVLAEVASGQAAGGVVLDPRR